MAGSKGGVRSERVVPLGGTFRFRCVKVQVLRDILVKTASEQLENV